MERLRKASETLRALSAAEDVPPQTAVAMDRRMVKSEDGIDLRRCVG